MSNLICMLLSEKQGLSWLLQNNIAVLKFKTLIHIMRPKRKHCFWKRVSHNQLVGRISLFGGFEFGASLYNFQLKLYFSFSTTELELTIQQPKKPSRGQCMYIWQVWIKCNKASFCMFSGGVTYIPSLFIIIVFFNFLKDI